MTAFSQFLGLSVLDDVAFADACDRLHRLAENSAVSAGVREQALRTFDRLRAGVCVYVLGPPSVGKSRLCDALLSNTEPETQPKETRVFYTSEGADFRSLPPIIGAQATRFRVEAERLGPVCLVDAHISSDPDYELSFYCAALKDADVVIWCTKTFTHREALHWSRAQETLKDHSFLVLCQADGLSTESAVSSQADGLERVAAEEFHSLFVTTHPTEDQMEGMGSDTIDQGNGIVALKEALRNLIASGRRADLDNAVFFLNRYSESELFVPNETGAAHNRSSSAVSVNVMKATLAKRSFDLAEMVFDEATGDMTDVLGCCEGIAQDLVGSLARDNQPGAFSALDEIFEVAADTITLLAAENGVRSAADAVTVLLQLRRDLAALHAH